MQGFIENRKNRRYHSIAKVRCPQFFTGDAVLKDISITGCCIEYTKPVKIEENAVHTLTICPEKTSKVQNFDIIAECKWVYTGEGFCKVGFSIKESPGKKDFLKYVDYLAWRHNM